MSIEVDLVFVPQGAEYRSVCRGLDEAGIPRAKAVPIPVGPRGTTHFFQQWLQHSTARWDTPPQAILMGLCGSLTPQLSVGDGVIGQACIDGTSGMDVPEACDSQIFLSLSQRLSEAVVPVTILTCDRIINTATEKQQLAQTYPAEVVDMEGYAALKSLQSFQIPMGIVRVVSDDAQHDLPDVNAALSPEGTLQTWPLAMGMLRQPIPAWRLIRGSLIGLKQLQNITTQIFKG